MLGKISSMVRSGVRTGLSSVKAGHTQKMPTESLAEILYGTLVKEGITSAKEFDLRADELIEDVRELSSFVGGIDEKAFSEIKQLALEKFRARNRGA